MFLKNYKVWVDGDYIGVMVSPSVRELRIDLKGNYGKNHKFKIRKVDK